MKLKDIVRESRETYKGHMSGIPVVGLEHLIPEEICFSEYEMCSDKTFTKAFHKGQVLFGRRRAYQKKAAIAHVDGVCSGDIMVLEAIPGKVEPSLLPFIIQNDRFFDYAIQHSEGGLSPRVKWNAIANYEFDLPSIEEQKVLADKLWAAYKVKESYRQLLSTTDEMLKAKFQEMFDFQDLDLTNPTNDFDKYCFDATSSATKIPAGNYLDEGKYAIYDQGQEKDIAGFTNTEDGVNKDYPVILFGDHSRVIKFINEPFFIGADGVKIIRVKDEKTLLPYFLFYDLLYHNIPNTGYNRHFKYIKMLKLTVPPMELQQQFAEIATQAEVTKASLRASIEAIDRVIRSFINQ
jgi:type I restriction enzyme S subunit